jgi:hypothetical protein
MNIGRVLTVAAITAGGFTISTTASAAPHVFIEHWHDEGSEQTEDFCDTGTTLLTEFNFDGRLSVVRHGDGLAYFTETINGWVKWTNLTTGKSFSATQTGISGRDLQIEDNGDGTITITSMGAGSYLLRDNRGRLVLKDDGQVRWQVIIDTNGTPGDPTDDIFVEDLGVVFGSTGTNDLQGRDFCEDYVLFTS